MKTVFRSSFTRDLKRIKDRSILDQVRLVIERIEAVNDLHAIANLQKISGTENFYRIRVGDYRIGIALNEREVEFVRCLHRRDIYRFFP